MWVPCDVIYLTFGQCMGSFQQCGLQAEYCLTTESNTLPASVVSIIFGRAPKTPKNPLRRVMSILPPPQKKYHFHWWWGTDLLPLKASKDSTSLFDMSKPRNLIPICRKPHSGVIDTKPAIVLVVSPAFLEKKHFRFLRIWDYVQKMDSNIPSNFRHKLWSKKNVHKFCKKKTSSCFFQIPTQWDGIHHPNFLPVKW